MWMIRARGRTCEPGQAWGSSFEERLQEGVGIEGLDILRPFSNTYEFDRDLHGILNRQHDASTSSPIQFRKDDSGQIHSLAERLGLSQGILALSGIKNQQDLMRRVGDLLGNDFLNLGELPHETLFGVHPTCRIDQQHIYSTSKGRFGRIEGHGGWIGQRETRVIAERIRALM